jgi:tetratricopeptide (TPR) repeat protein
MMRFASAICLCLALLAHAHAARAGSPAQTASKEQWRAAQKLFDAADELYDAGKYAEALTAYRASYDIVASPNSRLMVARSFLALGRLSHALRELERAEREANEVASHDVQYRRTAQAARAEIDALLTKNGRLTLVLEGAMADAAVSINGREMPKAELGDVLVFAPGRLVIVARMPSGTSTRRDVDLAAGTTVRPGSPRRAAAPFPY